MLLTPIQQHARLHGLSAAMQAAATAHEYCYLAFLSWHAGDLERAVASARMAATCAPDRLLPVAAAAYLERAAHQATPGVYIDPEGFSNFIRGGGNLALYQATSAALHHLYEAYTPATLLDIGPGDGQALLPALTPAITQIDLVEPATALLATLEQRLRDQGVDYRVFNEPIQAFARRTHAHWAFTQATFSLQSLPPDDLPELLAWLQRSTDRVAMVEFDVPDFPDQAGPQRSAYLIERYERGLAEYGDPHGIVAQGFLMPILFSSFVSGAARTNYEVPATTWRTRLQQAGFGMVQVTPLNDYWWAPAVLIEGTTPS